MDEKIWLDPLVEGQLPSAITGNDMNLMASFAQFMAEVIGSPTGTAHGIRIEHISQHENLPFAAAHLFIFS